MKKLLPALFFASFFNAYAQVYNAGALLSVYNDIIPDTLLNYTVAPYTHEVFDLDLFDSPAADLEFVAHGAVSSGGSGAYLNVTSLNPNVAILFGRWDSVYVIGSSTWDVTKVALPLTMGQQINTAGVTWDNGTLYLTDHSGHSGGNKNVNDWIGSSDKFLGIRYQNGNMSAYGWIRIQCPSEDSGYVKDLSHSTPQTSVEINSRETSRFYPNPAKDHFYLGNVNLTELTQLKLTDLYGQTIALTCSTEAEGVKMTFGQQVDLGCYYLQYSLEGKYFCTKVMVTK